MNIYPNSAISILGNTGECYMCTLQHVKVESMLRTRSNNFHHFWHPLFQIWTIHFSCTFL